MSTLNSLQTYSSSSQSGVCAHFCGNGEIRSTPAGKQRASGLSALVQFLCPGLQGHNAQRSKAEARISDSREIHLSL
jgi:hypothetical protein